MATDKAHNFEREGLIQFLTLAAYESFFIFDEKCYTQIDNVAMGSPLGPTLDNAFLCRPEKKCPSECNVDILPNLYKQYVDCIFCNF